MDYGQTHYALAASVHLELMGIRLIGYHVLCVLKATSVLNKLDMVTQMLVQLVI